MLSNHIANIKDCATEFIDKVNAKNKEVVVKNLEISEVLLYEEIKGKNRQVVERVMAVSSQMFVDAIALYMIENRLEIKDIKEDGK